MKCPECVAEMRNVKVRVEGAVNKVMSHQCSKCGYFEFDKKSSSKVIDELRLKEATLRIKQRIVKLSQGRLGIYINKHVVESLNLKSGKEIYVSVPDKKHILLRIE